MLRKIIKRLRALDILVPRFVDQIYFRSWVGRASMPEDLRSMMFAFIDSPAFATASKYWNELARQNIREVQSSGLDNFKQTVARHYFLLVKWRRFFIYRNLLAYLGEKDAVPLSQVMKKHEFLDEEASVSSNLFTFLLSAYVKRLPRASDYRALAEPAFGNPPTVEDEGRAVSSDLLNSVVDFDSVFSSVEKGAIGSILEVGGGYGRDAFVFSTLLPRCRRYIMVDIPPALFLAERYLTTVFPQKKAFTFRPFASFDEIKEEFERSELVFLMPDQIRLLPPKVADLILGIDCLHEMDKKQVDRYFREFDRLGKRLFIKCWQKTNPHFYQRGEYPAAPGWKKIFDRDTVVPAEYFEALWEIPD